MVGRSLIKEWKSFLNTDHSPYIYTYEWCTINELLYMFNFRTLRKLFKVDPADYMLSICGNDALRELSSPGKSGSFFYLTNDDKYMIKTMKKSEVKVSSFFYFLFIMVKSFSNPIHFLLEWCASFHFLPIKNVQLSIYIYI